ncbi:MAG: ribonuclease III [Clostridiales bacterium]|nr:ribonuclease III [Clostridiales bacterium]
MEKTDVQLQTPTALAFIGDAAMSLFVRKLIVSRGGATLHIASSRYVNATSQAAVFDELAIRGVFTQEESEIARRAKNAHLHSRTKAASLSEYHKATALEAVIGYLELKGDAERRDEILSMCVDIVDSNNCKGNT